MKKTMRRAASILAAVVALCAARSASAQVVEYVHLDALGSVRAITNSTGGVVERHDFMPFGEEWCAPPNCTPPPAGQARRFSEKERDTETGLDYFGARYYGANSGRFTTVDPVITFKANMISPQGWSRYTYTRNNPVRFVDPTGAIVQVNDAKALERIKSTLPSGVRDSVVLDGDRRIQLAPLSKATSRNANLLALIALVKNKRTLVVATGSAVKLEGKMIDFEYEGVASIVADLKAKGVTMDPKDLAPNSFLGYTSEGMDPVVSLSDATGSAATAPEVELAVTAAHEIYGHGLLQVRGQAWKHDQSGPVDKQIIGIQNRTRSLYER